MANYHSLESLNMFQTHSESTSLRVLSKSEANFYNLSTRLRPARLFEEMPADSLYRHIVQSLVWQPE